MNAPKPPGTTFCAINPINPVNPLNPLNPINPLNPMNPEPREAEYHTVAAATAGKAELEVGGCLFVWWFRVWGLGFIGFRV